MVSNNILVVDNIQDIKVSEHKVYKKRWLILILFVLYSFSNNIQFVIYSIIANKLVKYYGVSFTLIQMTSIIALIEYLIFTIPASYLIARFGLRKTVLMGLTCTCVGSWVKVASVDPSRYWVLILGQSIAGIFQSAIMPLPARVAAVWFPNDQVSIATSIGISGITGSAIIGYLLSPIIVSGNSINEIEYGLNILAYGIAILVTVLLPIIFLFFSDDPPVSPSAAQVNVKINKKPFKDSLKAIVTNRSFMILLFMFSMCGGMVLPVGIILNEVVLLYHNEAEKHVGYIGALTVITSLPGALLFGFVLDKFKKFKATVIIAYVCTSLSFIFFIYMLSLSVYGIYIAGCLLGFFVIGCSLTTLSLGMELTHPEPEGTVAGLLVSVEKTFALGFVFLFPYLLNNKSINFFTILMTCMLAATLLLFFFMKFDLRRQRAENISLEHKDTVVTN